MNIRSTIASAILAIILATLSNTVFAADLGVVGVWSLVSLSVEDAQTGAVHQRAFGEHPIGLLTYTAAGHMSAIIAAEGRKPLSGMGEKRLEESAQLFATMTGYAGTYSVQGGTVTHHVEVAGDPSWIGKDQIRFAKLENGILTISTPPMLNSANGSSYKITAVWKRLE
jgi:hypothetical protein